MESYEEEALRLFHESGQKPKPGNPRSRIRGRMFETMIKHHGIKLGSEEGTEIFNAVGRALDTYLSKSADS